MPERAPLFENEDGLAPNTCRLYDSVMRRFNAFVPEPERLTQDGIRSFLKHLDEKAYSRNYIRTCRRVLHANLPTWPFRRSSHPKIPVDQADLCRPVLSLDEMRAMKTWAEAHGDIESRAFLALSTVYGLRCQEIADLDESSFLERKDKVRILTVKGGETRVHLVPPELRSTLILHTFQQKTPRYCGMLFRRMRLNTGGDPNERVGWHSIRRALVTGLMRVGLDPIVIGSFLRWKFKVADIPQMIATYDRRPPEEIDQAVFDVHPFLDLWR